MTDYLVISFPHESGSWVAVLPDFVGVTGRGADLAQAIDRATEGAIAVIKTMENIDAPLPQPRDLREIQADHAWANEYGITWSCAVVSTVPLQAEPAREPAPVTHQEHRRRLPAAGEARRADAHV